MFSLRAAIASKNALSPPTRGGLAGGITWSCNKDGGTMACKVRAIFGVGVVLVLAIELAKWFDDIRRWKNPITLVLVHVLYLVLVWYLDLIVPTRFLYMVLIGVWYYRFRPKIPPSMDIKLS
ncbi:hypothetical protein CRYUN_Cryun19dG0043200 [Craigia yunnanensis]